ncbi:MAG: HNH endonuclease [bacterium]
MSYEGKMLQDLKMPRREDVERSLLLSLFKHNGVIKEFGQGQEIVNEIADIFRLDETQRKAFLETIYHKENRTKKSLLWHRLLFRAADTLAKRNLVSRPTDTYTLTKKKEWMLTEKGVDKALTLLNISKNLKTILLVKSFEVEKVKKKIISARRPINYDPIDVEKRTKKVTKETVIRSRGFRQAIVEAYDYRCSVCGMKINSPDSSSWEVEAAHIVPRSSFGKDDIWNGLALCRFHHWAFDVGWFTLFEDYKIQVSSKIGSVPFDFGGIGNFDIIRALPRDMSSIFLPKWSNIFPHKCSIQWHRENVFFY